MAIPSKCLYYYKSVFSMIRKLYRYSGVCGIPIDIGNKSDFTPFSKVNCGLPLRSLHIKSNAFFKFDEDRCDCHSGVYSSPPRLCKVNQQEFGRIPDTICQLLVRCKIITLEDVLYESGLISNSIILPKCQGH